MLEQFSNVEQIFIVVAILYAIEMLVWARGDSGVVSSFFGKFRLRTSRSVLSNDFGRLYFSGIAPWDAAFVLQPLPISVNANGFTNVLTAAAGSNRRPNVRAIYLGFEDQPSLTLDTHKVLIGGQIFCTLPTAASARNFLRTLHQLSAAEPKERQQLISRLHFEQFDVEGVRSRIKAWDLNTKKLGWCSSFLFLWIFAAGPILYTCH